MLALRITSKCWWRCFEELYYKFLLFCDFLTSSSLLNTVETFSFSCTSPPCYFLGQTDVLLEQFEDGHRNSYI